MGGRGWSTVLMLIYYQHFNMAQSSRVLTCPDNKKYYIPFYPNYTHTHTKKVVILSTNKSILKFQR